MGLGHSFLPSSSRCVSSGRGHSQNKPERKQCYKSTYRRRGEQWGIRLDLVRRVAEVGRPLMLACSAEPRCLPGAKISSYIEDVEAVYPRPGLSLCLLMPLLHLLDASIQGRNTRTRPLSRRLMVVGMSRAARHGHRQQCMTTPAGGWMQAVGWLHAPLHLLDDAIRRKDHVRGL
jgi:hypothetical protein